ncbi:MAG: acyltransferase family protein [Acidimicrobiales bacterium]
MTAGRRGTVVGGTGEHRPPLGVGTRLGYMPALDGIRAVSIIGIMANHGGFSWAAGGVISVNVFFVLSGFLITMLLMKEWSRQGTIRLRAFWARRARRLLPALFVLLGGIGVYALLFMPGGTQSSVRSDGLSTLVYISNWHQIFSGQSYFAQVSAQSPLLHTWTLAIEEQFYLVWPLVVVAVLKLWRSPRVLLIVTVVAVVASAVEMALLFHPGTDPSRIYYGTDTRAQDILTGAAAGILLCGRRPASSRRARRGASWLAFIAAAGFAWEWSQIDGTSALPYRGGFLLADVLVVLVIVGVTMAPAGIPARALSFAPLRFVGQVSYGLYLWHWPIFLVLTSERTGLEGWSLFALRCAVTFVIAVISWYLVETPVRQMTFGGWRSWSWVPVGALAAAGVLFGTTVGGAAAAGNILLNPQAERSRLTSYENGAFPKAAAPVKVLVVGDSLSLTVGFWVAQYESQYGVVLRGRPLDGCGLATAVPFDMRGTPTYPLAPCTSWPTIWQQEVRQLRPAVVVLVVGWWETMDRMYQGRWQHLGDPDFDAYEVSRFEEAVSVLSSGGAHVVLMTAPYFDAGTQPDGQPWDEDAPARVDLLNRMIEGVAARHRHLVSVVPLNRYLDPGGRFTWKIDGRQVRFDDGVHTTEAAGTYLAPKILPLLAAAAKPS